MKQSREHHGGHSSPSKVRKDSPAQSGARHEEGEGKSIEAAPATGPRFAVSADHEERVQSERARKKSVAGQSTASRASGTTVKSSQATSKAHELGTDVRAYIKQLAQEEKDDEAHFTRARLRVEGLARFHHDDNDKHFNSGVTGKLLAQLNAHHDHGAEHDADATRNVVGQKLLVVLEVLSRHKVLVVVLFVALVLLVAISVAVYLIFGGRKAAYAASPEPLLSGVLPACRSKECASALEILNLSMDASADPCRDAYALTCGKWRFTDEQGEQVSYKRLVDGRFEWKAHMLLYANSTHSRPQLYVPSRIYRSCISFLTEDRARLLDVLNASGVDPIMWLGVANFSELYTLIVDTAMANRLDNIFRIERGTGLPIVATGRETLRVIKMDPAYDWMSIKRRVVSLDDAVHSITEEYRNSTATNVVYASVLDSEKRGVHWAPMLLKYVNESSANAQGVKIAVNNVSAIRSLVSMLDRAYLKAASLYTLWVPVAEFMSIEYSVSTKRGRMPYGYRRRTCLANVYRFLREPFAWLLARSLQDNGTIHVAAAMWSALKHVGASMRTVAEGWQLSDMKLMHYDMKAEGDHTYNVSKGFSPVYGDAFVSNLVMHVNLTGRRVHARAALSPNLTKGDHVPSVYLIPDYFYPTAAETNINYGTLGVRMAEMMFNHSVRGDRLAGHKKWATEVALLSWKNEQPGVSSFPPLTQLFFLRFSLVYCGSSPNRRLSLLFATRTSASYAAAFNCSTPPLSPC
ncbi:hypothetical protein MTO96_026151 [Rhipicephalus appendiculatus]